MAILNVMHAAITYRNVTLLRDLRHGLPIISYGFLWTHTSTWKVKSTTKYHCLAQRKFHSLALRSKVGFHKATQGVWSWFPQMELEKLCWFSYFKRPVGISFCNGKCHPTQRSCREIVRLRTQQQKPPKVTTMHRVLDSMQVSHLSQAS